MVSFDRDKRKGDGHKGMLEGRGLTTPTKQQFRPKKANRKASQMVNIISQMPIKAEQDL